LEEMQRNVNQQRQIVADLRQELGVVRHRMAAYRSLFERSFVQRATLRAQEQAAKKSRDGGLIPGIPDPLDLANAAEEAVKFVGEAVGTVGEFLFGSERDSAGQSRQDALKEVMQRTADEERDLLFRLEREVTALNTITEAYSKALAEHLNHKTEVARLRVHIKGNLLHYMQAIWSYEPADQRFFRLHNVAVPVLEAAKRTYFFRDLNAVRSSLVNVAHRRIELNGTLPTDIYQFGVAAKLEPQFRSTTLVQVADLDNLLGFKGNYMVFPLNESNALTDYMMEPYVVAVFDELVDPDDLGNWTLEEFARYVCCLKENLSDEQFETLKEQLAEQYERLLTEPRRNGDVITLPTDSLFIEALPARYSLIEEFKARHRAVDVKKVQAEARKQELENIRRAARILAGEREDPDIEKKIVVEGAPVPPGEL
jgi:hypothetical protein